MWLSPTLGLTRRPGAPRSPAAAFAISVASASLPSPNPSRHSSGGLRASGPDRLWGWPQASDLSAGCGGCGLALFLCTRCRLWLRGLPQKRGRLGSRGGAGLRAGGAAGSINRAPFPRERTDPGAPRGPLQGDVSFQGLSRGPMHGGAGRDGGAGVESSDIPLQAPCLRCPARSVASLDPRLWG